MKRSEVNIPNVSARWLLMLASLALATSCVDPRSASRDSKDNLSVSVSRDQINFLLAQDSDESDLARYRNIDLHNSSGAKLNWAAMVDEPWITLTPLSGQIKSETDTLGIGIIPDQLTPGVYTTDIRLVTNVGEESTSEQQLIKVRVRVCEKACIDVSLPDSVHRVSPLLFGSQSEFLNSGTGVWDSITTADCRDPDIPPGQPSQAQLDEIRQLGISNLRYPSGTPSDFFNWEESVGPMESRLPQINPWVSTQANVIKQCPVFGPDEFVEYAEELDATILITTNSANGTAQQAADWLRYYDARSVEVAFWQVGNEVYIEGPEYLFDESYMTPLEYASAYDAHARALRQVRPDVTVGAIMSPLDQVWNREAMAAITEPVDFFSVHAWQPLVDSCAQTSDEEIFRSLLASSLLLDIELQNVRDLAREVGIPANHDPEFILTEWGAWFLACQSGTQNNEERARSLAGALYSGLIFAKMMQEPDVISAYHSTLSSLAAQAALNFVRINDEWVAIRSAHYYVHKLYAESIGGMVIPTDTHGSPTFLAKLFDADPLPTELPVLDSVAVLSEDESTLYVYVTNRSLTDAAEIQLFTDRLPFNANSITVETLTADNFSDLNTAAEPDAVGVVTSSVAVEDELSYTLPVHSLVRFAFSIDPP